LPESTSQCQLQCKIVPGLQSKSIPPEDGKLTSQVLFG